jgi:hypothetical protein
MTNYLKGLTTYQAWVLIYFEIIFCCKHSVMGGEVGAYVSQQWQNVDENVITYYSEVTHGFK